MRLLPSPRFILGANLPWVGYGTDIGASAWYPAGGLSAQPASLGLLNRTFATLAGDGISLVRTFLLCDLRSGAQFDSNGIPTGLDDVVFLDIDALVAVARQHHVRLMPVLLDFHLCGFTRIVNGVQLGGRSRLIEDAATRSALVDLVLRPIVEQYREEEVIAAWDIMNEPEWCLGIGPRTIELLAHENDVIDQAFREGPGCPTSMAKATRNTPAASRTTCSRLSTRRTSPR